MPFLSVSSFLGLGLLSKALLKLASTEARTSSIHSKAFHEEAAFSRGFVPIWRCFALLLRVLNAIIRHHKENEWMVHKWIWFWYLWQYLHIHDYAKVDLGSTPKGRKDVKDFFSFTWLYRFRAYFISLSLETFHYCLMNEPLNEWQNIISKIEFFRLESFTYKYLVYLQRLHIMNGSMNGMNEDASSFDLQLFL